VSGPSGGGGLPDRSARRDDPSAWSCRSDQGMVATAHWAATAAGARVLGRGGNAVDAAVAASFALGVCEPAGSGLGGMGMMLVHDAASGGTHALEGPCRAPVAATPEAAAAGRRSPGHPAAAVPSHVALVARALERFGTLGAAEVLAPAIELAERGYPVSALQARLLAKAARSLRPDALARFRARFPMPGTPGATFRQPDLARTLRRLASAGFEDFYVGEVGEALAADMAARGGFVSSADLRDVPWPTEREPLRGASGPYDVHTLGPPGGGTSLLQMLQVHEEAPELLDDLTSPEAVAALAMIIRSVRRDRRRHRLDADDGGARRLGHASARALAASVRRDLGGEGETTHLSVVDARGNAVALTQSIERSFGAKVAAGGLGFLLNGYMRAFKVQNRRHPHFLRPGAVARSNAAPTLLLRGGRVAAAVGSTGSERLASAIFGVLVRLRTADPFTAVHAPRLHATPTGEVLLEAGRFPAPCRAALERHGFALEPLEPYAFKMGGLQLVTREDDHLTGVADPRRDGSASGPAR